VVGKKDRGISRRVRRSETALLLHSLNSRTSLGLEARLFDNLHDSEASVGQEVEI
jgi:hypothetical protein